MKIKKLMLAACIFGIAVSGFSQNEVDLLILNKNYNEALLQIDQKIQTGPVAELFLKKGMILKSMQKYQDALAAFATGLEHAPDNFDLNCEIAETHSVLGNHYDAIKFYKKAVARDSENLAVKGKLGRTYINIENFKEAYDLFAEIYLVDSTNTYWNKQFGYSAFKTGKREEARNLYEKVIEQNPRDYQSYFNLAHLYSSKERGKTEDLLRQGLTQFPNDPAFHLEFANLYFGSKQYELAIPEFEAYFAESGDSTFNEQLNYGVSCYLAGDEEKALSVLQNIYYKNPNDAILLFYMSLCNKKLNDFEKAESYMEGAIDMSYPSWLPEMFHHLGQIYGQQRKFQESIDALKKSNEFDPTNPEVLFEIATTYEEFNSNKTLALNYYQIYLREAGAEGRNISYALERVERIKEDLFFEQ